MKIQSASSTMSFLGRVTMLIILLVTNTGFYIPGAPSLTMKEKINQLPVITNEDKAVDVDFTIVDPPGQIPSDLDRMRNPVEDSSLFADAPQMRPGNRPMKDPENLHFEYPAMDFRSWSQFQLTPKYKSPVIPGSNAIVESADAVSGAVSGYVFKADGVTVITDVLISVHAHGISEGSSSLGTYVSQEDGSYTISGLAPGTYKIQANNNKEQGYINKYFNNKLTWEGADTIEVVAGETTQNINFTLETGGSISGHVYQNDNVTPIQDAWICFRGYYDHDWYGCISSDADGWYTRTGLIPGDYRVEASAPGRVDYWYNNTPNYNEATKVNVQDGTNTPGINFALDPGGSVSGRVVRTSDGAPIADMSVAVVGENFGRDTCTDADGNYQINNLPYGTWRVRTNATVSWCGDPQNYIQEYWQEKTNWGEADPITLSSATPDLGNINFTLAPGGSISGHVYETDGVTPVPHAWVNVMLLHENDRVAYTQADADGFYMISGLGARTDYKVEAGKNGYHRAYYPHQARWSEAVMVSVQTEQTTSGIDIRLVKADALVTGRVTFENGSPVSNVWMEAFHNDGWFVGINADENGEYQVPVSAGIWQLFPYNPPYVTEGRTFSISSGQTISGIDFVLHPGGSVSGTVTAESNGSPLANITIGVERTSDHNWWYGCSDGNGQYQVQGIPYSDYKVWARAAENCGSNENYQQEYWQEKTGWDEANVIVLSASTPEVNSINFTLIPGGGISGHVYEADGVTPIQNAWVWAMDTNFTYTAGSDHSQSDGSYSITGLSQGDFYLAVQADGFGGVYYQNGYDDPSAVAVNVTPPNTTPNINFNLSPEATASGFVYQEDGTTPIADARVYIWPANGGQTRQANSNADGSYTVHGLSSGSYVAQAEAGGYTIEYYLNAVSWYSATPFTVTQPANTSGINFTLSIGGSISGTVAAESDGTPLMNMIVVAERTDGFTWSACTDGNGQYQIQGLPHGDYKAWSRSSLYACGEGNYQREYWQEKTSRDEADIVTISSTSLEVTNVNFTLIAGGSISGHVYEADGVTPITNAMVYAYDGNFQYIYGTYSLSDGSYKIRTLPSGNLYIFVNAEGYGIVFYENSIDFIGATPVPVTAPNDTPGKDFRLSREALVSGHVYRDDGITPVQGAEICVRPQGDGFSNCTNSAGDGVYSVDGLASGNYIAWASKPGFSTEYYEEVSSIDSAKALGVLQPNETSGIDFTLTLEPSTFADVPYDYSVEYGGVVYPLHDHIQALYDAGYTAGCSTDPLSYCPANTLTRAEAAVFMLRGLEGTSYAPPTDPGGYVFTDDWSSPTVSWGRSWAEGMWDEGLTSGCQASPKLFCPTTTLTRAEASVFGLRIENGAGYTPPAATHIFADDWSSPTISWAEAWAEQAYLHGLLPACGESGGKPLFCASDLVTRAWAAYLVVEAKDLLVTP